MTIQSLLLRLLPLPAPGRLLADTEWRTLVRLAEVLVPDGRLDAPTSYVPVSRRRRFAQIALDGGGVATW